jgi:thiosulfate dehydrogenase [quinone] large subunit
LAESPEQADASAADISPERRGKFQEIPSRIVDSRLVTSSARVAAATATVSKANRTTWRGRFREVGWALLPLRVFLGVTFVYAGLYKLFDPTYLSATAPGGVKRQMQLSAASSPIGGLIQHTIEHSTIFGLMIAFGELAVGLGLLLGLWTRIAALGGMALAFTFLLTVSWTTRPYFYGPDIVYLLAYTPFVLTGDGGVLSWGAVLRRSARRDLRLPATPLGPESAEILREVDRRTLLRTVGATAAVGAAALLVGGLGVAVNRSEGDGSESGAAPAPTPALSSTAPPAAGAPAGATLIGAASAIAVGRSVSFTDPRSGGPAILLQPRSGSFLAYTAVCTHEGCTVSYDGRQFSCPCHGATFDATTGDVTGGPARGPLTKINVQMVNGQVYAV